MTEYISTVNHLVLDAINGRAITKITTADVNAALPSALCNQCIRDAKSIIRKYNKVLRNSIYCLITESGAPPTVDTK